ncbi:MAG TPA: hypothetical protein ENI57_10775 [Ignavibacteria bacterium]|nr:hypothetical protein [Ignavibacteria bacterium]
MKIEYLIIFSLLIFIIVYVIHLYVYSIYEVTAVAKPGTLHSDNNSKTIIRVIPINSLGKKAPFRSVPVCFNLIEGKNLVSIEYKNNKKGITVLKVKDKPGIVKIEITSKYSLFPNIVEIIIN